MAKLTLRLRRVKHIEEEYFIDGSYLLDIDYRDSSKCAWRHRIGFLVAGIACLYCEQPRRCGRQNSNSS